jgi:hypothetical protein
MKLHKNLLAVIAATGVMGSAQAQNTIPLGTLTPTVSVATGTFTSGSFLDTVTFQLDATNHIVQGTTTSTSVNNLTFKLFADGVITPLATGLNLNQSLAAGSYHALIAGDVVTGAASGQFTFSVAAHNPEPAEWMLMLSGLVVAGFIARRKIGSVAG